MSRPDFLVIGAQKCGTTTLTADLRSHPQVRLAPKESAYLTRDAHAGPGAASYFDRLPQGGRGLRVGEVATDYAMLPLRDAASRARAVLDSLRVVYIVRHPLDRVLSHHHHLIVEDAVPTDLASAIALRPDIVDNSRYATQLTPWLEAFGRDAVHVIRFEDYVAERQPGFDRLAGFLGLEPHRLPEPERSHNRYAQKRVAMGWRRRLFRTGAYQLVRRHTPDGLRHRVVRPFLAKPPPRPPRPPQALLDELWSTLAPETERLAALLGTEPWWSVETG